MLKEKKYMSFFVFSKNVVIVVCPFLVEKNEFFFFFFFFFFLLPFHSPHISSSTHQYISLLTLSPRIIYFLNILLTENCTCFIMHTQPNTWFHNQNNYIKLLQRSTSIHFLYFIVFFNIEDNFSSLTNNRP